MINKNIKKGFTLIEIGLVLSIATFIGFIAFSQILKNQEFIKAQFAGDQIKQLGDATNAYISNHYDTLSTLTNSTGSSTDTGTRTCSTSTNTCIINTTTLVNEGLLPSSYSGKNVYGYGYNIILKRTGTSPYYKINGLIVTDSSLKIGNNIRYDLLGQSIQRAGIDSGMTRDSSSQVSGFNGSWNANSSDYSNINKLGQLAYQAGYGTYNYSVFLRRDGTLPMTGNLNMGSNSINNVVDYNGTGNINTGGKIVAGSEVTAENGYGDTITLGGDSSGSDYELRLGTAKPLTIYSPNATQYSTVLNVNRNTIINERLATNGLNPNDLPSNWVGGIRTYDAYASGTVGVGTSGNLAAYLNSSGQIYANTQITTAGKIATNGLDPNILPPNFSAGGIRTYDIVASGSFYSILSGTNISDGKYAFYARQDGNVQASGNINAGGNISGQYLLSNLSQSLGATCSTNGLISKQSDGTPIYCINGYWTNIPVNKTTTNGGMLLPNGMKLMWGSVTGNTQSNIYDSTTGVYETNGLAYTPSFTANGITYNFNSILNVQYTVNDVPGVSQQEQIWGNWSGTTLTFRMAAKAVTTMTGYYFVIGY